MTTPAQDGLVPPSDVTPAGHLFGTELFAGFGPSVFRAAGQAPIGRLVRGLRAEQLQAGVREHAPRHPGVYGMLDGKGRVVYIGKAKCLRTRLSCYFREKSRDRKAGKIINAARTLCWEECPDELGALLRELELIRRFKPKFNVLGMPGPRRYVYLCLSRGPAPVLTLTRTPTRKETAAYGPFVGRGRLFHRIRKLNDVFRLRDCAQRTPLRFADEPALFPEDANPKCLRYELGTCPGPCAGMTTRENYARGPLALIAFLNGTDTTPLSDLLKQMRLASAELRFEAASILRDRMQALEWIHDRLTFLRTARQGGAFVYPLRGPDRRVTWYFINHGMIHAAVREPKTASAKARVADLMTRTFAAPADAVTYATVDSVLLVAAWFKKNSTEKARLLTRSQAYAVCGVPCPALAAETPEPPEARAAPVAGSPESC